MEVNNEKLAQGNLLGKNLAKKAGYKRTKYWQFLKDNCFTTINPDIKPYLDDILYAKELATTLCPQYHHLIWKETKPLRHLTDDEKLSIGYEAIWKALHQYTNPKTNITQWIMFSIRMYSKKNTRKQNNEVFITDYIKMSTQDQKQPKPDIPHTEETVLNDWIRKANLNQEHQTILHFYLTRAASKAWIQDYLKDFYTRTGQTRHPKGITAKIIEIKRKLATILKKEGIDLPIAV
jgi:hypothetical protein